MVRGACLCGELGHLYTVIQLSSEKNALDRRTVGTFDNGDPGYPVVSRCSLLSQLPTKICLFVRCVCSTIVMSCAK